MSSASDGLGAGAAPSKAPHLRWLALALACAGAGLLPLGATRDPVALLGWLGLAAPSIGILAGAARLPVWPWGASIPAAWMVALSMVGVAAPRILPSPAWAAAAWSGLFLAGFGLGRFHPAARARMAALVLMSGVFLAGLPIGMGFGDAPFDPVWTARLLDLAPTTWILESAGVDWARHPALYERAHTFDIGPELRAPFRGALAGPSLFLVGCALAWFGVRRERRRRAPEAPHPTRA